MSVNFNFNRKDVQRLTGKLNLPGEGNYIYKHMNHGSGMCPKCAPFLGVLTSGDGSDGVPVPPVHPNCKCYLRRLWLETVDEKLSDRLGVDRERDLWLEHFEWLESLPYSRLADILGPVRVDYLRHKFLTISDLYDGARLIPLVELGILASGRVDIQSDSVEELFSSASAVEALTDFHISHFNDLPEWLKAGGPGNMVSVRNMTAIGLLALSSKSGGRALPWLLLLVSLLQALRDSQGRNQ